MRAPRVLFLCTGNACRSQIAEGWLKSLAGERFQVLSAGTEAHGLNPRAVETMAAAGVDISGQQSEIVDAYLADGLDLIVTVCDRAAENCPELPLSTEVLHWPFPDPAGAQGDEHAIQATFGRVRDSIRGRIQRWLDEGTPLPGGGTLSGCESPS